GRGEAEREQVPSPPQRLAGDLNLVHVVSPSNSPSAVRWRAACAQCTRTHERDQDNVGRSGRNSTAGSSGPLIYGCATGAQWESSRFGIERSSVQIRPVALCTTRR